MHKGVHIKLFQGKDDLATGTSCANDIVPVPTCTPQGSQDITRDQLDPHKELSKATLLLLVQNST